MRGESGFSILDSVHHLSSSGGLHPYKMGTTLPIIFKLDQQDQILLALPFLIQLADLQLQIFDGRPQRIRELTRLWGSILNLSLESVRYMLVAANMSPTRKNKFKCKRVQKIV